MITIKNKVLFEGLRLRTILGVALLAGACGGPSGAETSDPSSSSASAPITLQFELDTPAHKTGTVVGNGTSVAFDFLRKDKDFTLEVKTASGQPLVTYAATRDEYIQRVLGNQLEVKWSRAIVDARTNENIVERAAQARQANGDESVLPKLAERSEFPLVNALYGALKTSIDEATATGPSVLALPGDGEGGGGTGGNCIAECRGYGTPESECVRRCMGQPPYQCTPQDNSTNHRACNAGVDAWAAACTYNPIGVLATFTSWACAAVGLGCPTCHSIEEQMRRDCPAATICI